MNTILITTENYKVKVNEVLKSVFDRAQSNGEYGYSCESVIFIGENAINDFLINYAPNARTEFQSKPKTDGKTTAILLPYLCAEAYHDTRYNNDTAGGLGHFCSNCYYSINWCILFDGVYYKLDNLSNRSTHDMYYLVDSTDYRHYLPYKWNELNPAPQKIGTITDNKLQAWADFLKAKKAAANEKKDEKTAKVVSFLERVHNIDLSDLNPADYRITDKGGYIIQNGLKFTYSISEEKCIDTSLEVNTRIGDWDKLSNFEKMAKGVY